jgi:hypothetical protein
MHGFRQPTRRREWRHEIDDTIGHRQYSAVVGCDHHHAFALR